MDFVKHVVMPIRQVAQRTSLRGFTEDYYHIDADVVLLAGETHLYRKPVSVRTSTCLLVILSFHRVRCALPPEQCKSCSSAWYCTMSFPATRSTNSRENWTFEFLRSTTDGNGWPPTFVEETVGV